MATKTIWGTVAGNGRIISGSGFSVRKEEKGRYLIGFDTNFSRVPAIVGSHTGHKNLGQNTKDNVVFPFLSVSSATAKVGDYNGNPVDFQFSFIAIGES
ncbi:MAG: hypothetical protein JXR05_14605 [Flavobacteriaceae bacterium]